MVNLRSLHIILSAGLTSHEYMNRKFKVVRNSARQYNLPIYEFLPIDQVLTTKTLPHAVVTSNYLKPILKCQNVAPQSRQATPQSCNHEVTEISRAVFSMKTYLCPS